MSIVINDPDQEKCLYDAYNKTDILKAKFEEYKTTYTNIETIKKIGTDILDMAGIRDIDIRVLDFSEFPHLSRFTVAFQSDYRETKQKVIVINCDYLLGILEAGIYRIAELFLHEGGHAIGLVHVDGGLMKQGINISIKERWYTE